MQILFLFRILSTRKLTARKVLNFLANLIQYHRKLSAGRMYPTVLELNITNRCNLMCSTCRHSPTEITPWSDGNVKHDGHDGKIVLGSMDKKLLDIITEDKAMKHVLAVKLYGAGEPLLNPHLYDTIRRLSERRVATIIATNGMLLNKENSIKLIESGLDVIKIAISGFSQEVYGKYHKGGDINKILENLKMLAKLRKEYSSNMVIVLDYLLFKHNTHEVSFVRSFCKNAGLAMMVRGGILMKQDVSGLQVTTEPKQSNKLCDWIWSMMTIDWDGKVVPCCWYLYSTGPVVLGQYNASNSIHDIWNSKLFAEYRSVHLNRGRSAFNVCRGCFLGELGFRPCKQKTVNQ